MIPQSCFSFGSTHHLCRSQHVEPGNTDRNLMLATASVEKWEFHFSAAAPAWSLLRALLSASQEEAALVVAASPKAMLCLALLPHPKNGTAAVAVATANDKSTFLFRIFVSSLSLARWPGSPLFVFVAYTRLLLIV